MLYQLDYGSGSYRSDTRLYRTLDQTYYLENSWNWFEWSDTVVIFQLNFFDRTVCVALVSESLLFTVSLAFPFSTYSYSKYRRLGDISNGSSSLEFIKDMKSLSTLVLRNSNLTGTIPSNIGEYSSLQQVDLRFNKLHGSIPASLFNLSGLTHLFLGNNTLNGSLPTQKRQSLSNIDVSYNDLSGSLPSWASLPNLKL
ncbi:putative LRR receptor-like serine/threonine-protein kinase [Cardamine amara subsp. amara]|uniref:LRR receptor-like serine/threonine-protein kinase n=1 Tax=Cardamine amara subsp. amara TaxID=228776 RepID=A0ABD1BW95_CARAN